MPTPQPIPFWIQSAEPRSSAVIAERLVNWYLEKNPQNAKYPYALYPTPGLSLLTTVGDGPIRGMHAMRSDLYVVSGDRVYRVQNNYAITDLGDVGGTGSVYMTDNGSHVLVVTNRYAYAVNTSEIIQIPEEFLLTSAYQDGYAIAVKRGTEDFYISGLDDMTAWAALDMSNADAKPDNLIAVASVKRLLWLFGATTTELWWHSGEASFPFTRSQGGFMEIGCMAPGSVAVIDNKVVWLGHDFNVYMAAGPEPQIVSPPGIAHQIELTSSPQTATAFVYNQAGHTFYVLSLVDKTLVFDVTMGTWHYRESRGEDRWRVNAYAYIWKTRICGDFENGQLYELDLDTYSEDGEEIRREADSPPIFATGDRVFMHELFVDMEPGVGIDGSGQGSDPILMLSWSDDMGATWSNEIELSIGKIGEYGKQCRANRLGQFRQRSVRIAVSDPVKAVVTGAYARMEREAA